MKPFVVLVGAFLLAGCVGDRPSPVADPGASDALDALTWEEIGALLYSETHDHVDRDLHTEVRRGVKLLNRSTLSVDGLSMGEYIEIDAAQGLLAVGTVTGVGSTMHVSLLDQAALPAISILGSFVEPQAYGDVKFDKQQPRIYVPYAMPAVPDGKAFSIWDVTDPASPARLGEVPGVGCHMLHPMTIDSTSYVWCAAVDGAQVYRMVDLPDGSVTGVPLIPAEPVGVIEVARYPTYYEYLGTPRAWVMRVHDMTFQEDPLTGNPVLVTAHELQGIRVYDVANPAVPVPLGYWAGDALDKPMDRVHTVGMAKIGDRRIALGATETFNNVRPSLYIVDFTDYANPRFLAEWNPPGIETDQRLTYALHNFQVVDTTLYIANFHAGLWALDVSEPSAPFPIGLSAPVWDTEYPYPGQMDLPGFRNAQNMYWDVVIVDGYAIASDMSAGIEVLHFEGDPAGQEDHDSRF